MLSVNSKLDLLPASLKGEVEAWVVNTVKVKMIQKLDSVLENDGKNNARNLFLTPIFTINELKKRVDEQAPELKNYFFRELVLTIDEAEKRLV